MTDLTSGKGDPALIAFVRERLKEAEESRDSHAKTSSMWFATVRADSVSLGESHRDISKRYAKQVRMFTALLSVLESSGSGTEQALRCALERVARWHGEFPATGREWPDGSPMSYSAAFGSNGERDYMRQLALDALASSPASVATGAAADRPDVRGIVEALGFDPTNHHNALGCPYCNPDRLTLASSAPLPDAAPAGDVTARYYELLFAVGRKYPGELRHETALRYIRQAEAASASPAAKEWE